MVGGLILLIVYSVGLELVPPPADWPASSACQTRWPPPCPYHPQQTWLPRLQFGLLPSLPLYQPFSPVPSSVTVPVSTLHPLLPLSVRFKNSNRGTGAPQKREQKQTPALRPTVNTVWRGLWKAWGRHCVQKGLAFAVVSSLWVAEPVQILDCLFVYGGPSSRGGSIYGNGETKAKGWGFVKVLMKFVGTFCF